MAELTEYERLRLENDVVMLAALQYLVMLGRVSANVYQYEGVDLHERLAERAKETEEALSATRLERILRGESR